MEAKGYVILTEDIHDAEGMAAYGRASAASPRSSEDGRSSSITMSRFSRAPRTAPGRWSSSSSPSTGLAPGTRRRSYQSALPLRLAAAECTVVIVEGFTLEPRALLRRVGTGRARSSCAPFPFR